MDFKIKAIVGVLLILGVTIIGYLAFSSSPVLGDMENKTQDVEQVQVKENGEESAIVPPMDKPVEADITSITPGNVGLISLAEVNKHSKAEDCWMAIEGKVYDMTPYIQKQIHPGGAAILFGCGKDSTAIFNLRPKDNKPHSSKARSILEDYYLGELGN